MNDITEIREGTAYPLLPMRGLSVFPGMLINFDVIRPMSVAALKSASNKEQMVFMVAQQDISKENPKREDLYEIGTLCRVKQSLKVPGTDIVRVLAEGITRARIVDFETRPSLLYAKVEPVEDSSARLSPAKIEAAMRQCISSFDRYTQVAPNLSPDMLAKAASAQTPAFMADYIAQNIYLRHEKKQQLLEEIRPLNRLALLTRFLNHEISVITFEQEINEKTHENMNRNQKDFYLREQMKVIQTELGDYDELEELDDYRDRILELNLSEEITEKLLKELTRLTKQPPNSSEGAVIRTYLDTCLDLPWHKRTRETNNTAKARKILDDDHFGLDKVKERIIEYIAVRQLAPNLKGTVLCLVGPPGTGKTSIAMSIARATNRKAVRLSLGGVHDEAEIRGHRKTYVGAMPKGRFHRHQTEAVVA